MNVAMGMTLDFEMLTAEEVSKILRVSSKTVYRLALAGTIPCFRQGRVVRFLTEDIERYILSRRGAAHGLDRPGQEKSAVHGRVEGVR